MKKKKHGFWRFYLIFTLVLAAVFAAVVAVLWFRMSAYQKNYEAEKAAEEQAEQQRQAELAAPDECVRSFLAEADAAYFRDLWFSSNPDSLDGEDAVEAYFEELLTENPPEPFREEGYSDAAPLYVLKAGTQPLAEVTVSGTGTDRQIDTVTLLLTADKEGSATAPEGVTVLCNGHPLDDSCITGTEEVPYPETITEWVSEPATLNTWTVSGLLLEPEFTYSGDENTVFSEQDGCMVPKADAETAEALCERSETFLDRVLRYFMSGPDSSTNNIDDRMYGCMQRTATMSPAWYSLLNAENGISWNPIYTDQNTDDMEAYEALQISENCICVDVRFHAYCASGDDPVDYAQGIYRFYFIDIGSGYEIYEMTYIPAEE